MNIRSATGAAAVLLLVTLGPAPAAAYVGPGAGISLIGAAIGLVLALITAIGIVIKRLLRRPPPRLHDRAIRQAEQGMEAGGE